jgi:hypothetical protein
VAVAAHEAVTDALVASRGVADILRGASEDLGSGASQAKQEFLTNIRSLPDFVFKVARTLDEHDEAETEVGADSAPGKPFPDWPYLHDMVDLYLNERLLLVEKARQLMLTWLFAAILVWELRSKPARRWGWVSLKEGHADAALDRMWSIVERMPGEAVRTQQGAKAFRDAGGVLWKRAHCIIEIPSLRSSVHAMSQSVDDARSFTFSGIVGDEVAFQPKFKDAYSALKPTIDKGRFVGITTAGPFGFCHDLYRGKSFEEIA